jgi:UDP-N-acetylmuramoylalanine--D-glutamate ligase
LGGLPKGDDLDACAPYLGHVRSAYTIGKAGRCSPGCCADKVPVSECGKLDRAVSAAAEEAKPGETVLLSPGVRVVRPVQGL